MTNNLIDLLPRFVMKDGAVVMPEDIQGFDLLDGFEPLVWVYEHKDVRHKHGLSLPIKDARTDRQSPFNDKNGKRIFGNDVVSREGFTGAVILNDEGVWVFRDAEKEKDFRLSFFCETLKITGMIKFGEEKG